MLAHYNNSLPVALRATFPEVNFEEMKFTDKGSMLIPLFFFAFLS